MLKILRFYMTIFICVRKNKHTPHSAANDDFPAQSGGPWGIFSSSELPMPVN